MTPEEKSLLEKTYEIAKENNGLLKSIRRSNRISSILRVAYWVIIIGLSIGAYYFVQPYADYLFKVLGGSDITSIRNASDSIQGYLKQGSTAQ